MTVSPAPPSFSIVVPAYNEEAGIEKSVREIRSWLEARGGDWELLVVDNASTDATVERLTPLLDGDRVRLLRNEHNGGKGFSVRRGMLAARGSLRLFCDVDCWRSLPSLAAMEEQAASYDVVIGSRLDGESEVARAQPLRRRIGGRTFLTLTRLVMGEPARDVFCGFKLWQARAAEDVFSRAQIDGWAFDAEVLALARGLGYSTVEQGILWINGEQSRLSMTRTIVPAARDLVRARRATRRTLRSHSGVAPEPL